MSADQIQQDGERELFERAALNITCANADSLKRDPESGDYEDYVVSTYWLFWQAARRSTPAISVAAARQEQGELPPLPEPVIFGTSRYGTIFKGHTDEAMREYGAACRAGDAKGGEE